ncbi:MAG: translation initiation factor IF-2 subunit alpha [Candidatus Aenigmatarchaeota archaeon]
MVKKRGLPQWGELVIVNVEKITPFAAWCKLVEYPEVEGMIHVSEVAGKWIYDIRDFVKVNKQYVAKVIKIDYQKNFVNLSLKRVSEEDEKEKMNSFRKEQRGEKLLEIAANKLGKTLDQAYEEVGFLLQEKFGSLLTPFEIVKSSEEELLKFGIKEEWIKAMKEVASSAFKEKEFVIKAELELKSYAKDGIEKIKKVLKEFANKTGASVKYISAPRYMVEIKGKDPKNLEKNLVKELEVLCENMKKLEGEGSFKILES